MNMNKNKRYYAFQYTIDEYATWEENPKLVQGFGYYFNTQAERDSWVKLSKTDAAMGLLRKSLTRDQARAKGRYGIFKYWGD